MEVDATSRVTRRKASATVLRYQPEPPMPNLAGALDSLTAQDDGLYGCQAPEGWTQGRTLYGGMTAALAAKAATMMAPELPPLRSALFSFIGPAAGALTFRPEILRQGRSATVVNIDALADGALIARGVLTYGAARQSSIHHALAPATNLPPPDACDPFTPQAQAMSGFHEKFERRLATGSRLFTGAAEAEFEVWVRYVEVADVDPTLALLALADSLPPAAMAAFTAPAPISTMTWMIDLIHPLPTDGWRLLRARSEACADGYSQQAMDVLAEDGTRIAVGRQTVAVFA
jgi:acyl-CoA thioesterase